MIVSLQIAIFVLLTISATVAALIAIARTDAAPSLKRILVLLSALTITAGLVLSQRSIDSVRAHLRDQIIGFAPTYAYEFMEFGATQVGFQTTPDDPLYLKLIDSQKRWLAVNPAIADIYTFRVVDGECRLLVDSETDYDRDGIYRGEREMRTTIGESFGEADELEFAAMAGQQIFVDDPYSDRWGTWVSAYSPIFDEHGKVHSVLGVDFPAKKWLSEIHTAQRNTLGMTLFFHCLTIGAACAIRIRGHALERAKRINEDLREAKLRAEAANRAKSEFLANMSHEIRTPMNSIIGFSQVLLEQETSTQVRETLDIVHRNATQLLTLINDILDLSRIESGRNTVRTESFDLLAMLNDIDQLMRVRIEEKQLKLTIDWPHNGPPHIVNDPDRVRQVLINLVGNAAKFTHKGEIRISAAFDGPINSNPGQPGTVRITVRDTGIGMTSEQLSRIFKPFEQADNSTTRIYGGTGLGLAICTRVAQALGGTIHAESQLGIGSSFHFTFPSLPISDALPHHNDTLAATTKHGTPTAANTANLSGLRILYAEDGLDNQKLIRHHLVKAGAQVDIAQNGKTAIDTYRRSPDAYHLILMDMQMPVLDGYTATARLREMGCTLPIIALTAHAMSGDREKCLGVGCDDYATKPVMRDTLIELCQRWGSPAIDNRSAA